MKYDIQYMRQFFKQKQISIFFFSFEAATEDCEFGEEWKFFPLEIFSTQNHIPKPYILSLKWEIAEKSAFDWENG